MVTVAMTPSDESRFPAALLRVALALREATAPDLEPIVKATVDAMGLDEPAFRRYIAENLDTLRTESAANPRTKGRGRNS